MDLRQTVLEAIAKVSGRPVSELRDELNLVADLAVDSVKSMELLIELEDRLHVEIDDENATTMATVADVIASATRLVEG